MTVVNAVEVNDSSTISRKPSNGETLISLVLDETGSMMSCLDSTISSVNDYLGSQKGLDGVCKASLFTFSDQGGYSNVQSFRTMNMTKVMQDARDTGDNFRPVFENQDIASVGFLDRTSYRPNGGTNLYDAIGKAIRKVEAQLEPLSEVPDVLITIVTDGGENASREFTLEGVKTLVKQKESEGWTFVYLGANQDAWQVGQSFGLSKGQTMSYDTANMAGTMSSLASATTTYRSLRSTGAVARGTSAKKFFADPETGNKKD